MPRGGPRFVYATQAERVAARQRQRRESAEREKAAIARAGGALHRGHIGISNKGWAVPPQPVLAEATAAHACGRSITAILMGDPLPGRSCLDRRT